MTEPQDPQPLEDDHQQSSWWDEGGPGYQPDRADGGTHDR